MERLELLGDSVLKYAAGNPEKHDRQLTDIRKRVICNATLNKLGTDLFLHLGYLGYKNVLLTVKESRRGEEVIFHMQTN